MAGGYQTWPLVEFKYIGDAWRLYKRHWFTWSLAMIIVSTAYSFVAGAAMALFDGHAIPRAHGGFRMFLTPGAGALPFLVSTVISGFFLGGLVRMASRQLRGQAPRIEDLLSVTDVWFDLLLVSFLNGAVTFLAFLFCAVPGLIVSGLFMLAHPAGRREQAAGDRGLDPELERTQIAMARCHHLQLRADPGNDFRGVTLRRRHIPDRASVLRSARRCSISGSSDRRRSASRQNMPSHFPKSESTHVKRGELIRFPRPSG